MKTLAILEGWAGGRHLSRKLRYEASQRGLKITKQTADADLIIAHSTGCYMLPDDLNAERILLINPPYWPGQSIIFRWIRMNKAELKFLRKEQGNLRFFGDKLWETYYVFAKPKFTWSVLKNQSHLDFLQRLQHKKITLVKNKNDEFCSPQIKIAVKKHKNVKYVEIPGYHGNYYINPKPYIDLLLKAL